MQRGILDFVKLYLKHCDIDRTISGADCMAPILLLYRNPDYVEQIINEGEFQMNLELGRDDITKCGISGPCV